MNYVSLLVCLAAVLPLSCANVQREDDDVKVATAGASSIYETASGGSTTGGGNSGGAAKSGGSNTGGSSAGDGGGGEALSGGGGDPTPQSANTGVCDGVFEGLESCGSEATIAETLPVNILLVIDKSGSMNDTPAGEQETLWESTQNALKGTLADASASVSFGLQLFPSSTVGEGCGSAGNCCEMPDEAGVSIAIEAGDGTKNAIVKLLDSTQPGGGTPAAAALARAYDYFDTGLGNELAGERFVLLATDGGPNCNGEISCGAETCTANIDIEKYPECAGINCCENQSEECLDDAGTVQEIQALRSLGVGTFVVGLAGSELYADQLDSFAIAGGHSREGADQSYFKVDAQGSAAGLSNVLREITQELLQTCNLQLGFSARLSALNVAVDCKIIPLEPEGVDDSAPEGSGGAANANGSYWVLDNETEPPTIHLRGAICDQIESVGVERIDVLDTCPTVLR